MRNIYSKNYHLLAVLLSCLVTTAGLHAQQTHILSSNSYVQEFNVIGPFHQKNLSPNDYAELLEIEFLEQDNSFKNGQYKLKPIVAKAKNNVFDFNKLLGDSAMAVAYAHIKLFANENTNALFLVKAQDGAMVSVNGEIVHAFFGGGWGDSGGQQFFAEIKKGENNVNFKVPNKDWDWNLSVKILDEKTANIYLHQENEKDQYFQFLHSGIQPKIDDNSSYTFYPGKFPELVFDKPGLAEKYLGKNYRIKTRWFDRAGNEVLYPKETGRYAFYAEAKGDNGIIIKRQATLFCAPADWMGWNNRLYADLNYLPVNDIPKKVWEKHKHAIGEYVGFDIYQSIANQEEGAVLLAFLDEMNKNNLPANKLNTPLIVDGDYHAIIKQKILGAENKYPKLKKPTAITNSNSNKLLPAQSKKYSALHEELMKVANEWIADYGTPFDMLLAKDGQIIFHEAFGEDGFGKFTIETPSEIASITKLFTGLLFAQFVDQGIIGIDDPVGKYLTEFPVTGPNALTLRHCFTHTNGFKGHGLFNGVHNPWLENSLALFIKKDTVGTRYRYNGMGYDLAGKVMEVVSGKSIFRLFREYLYEPLQMENTIHDWDLGYSVHSTALDLAKMAQMLLNKGSYGGLYFFSPATYDKLIPTDLKQFYPNIDQKWGIGQTMMMLNIKDEKTGKQRNLLSDNIIGHGSATASVFWVDLENNIVLTQSRRRGGHTFGPNFRKMVEVIEKHLVGK